MNGNGLLRRFMGIFFITAFSGCASNGGIITSLEDLSTDSVKEGFIKIPQYRVASIPGWLPFSDVGGLYFYKPSRKPASVIGLSPGSSFELVSEIIGEGDQICDQTCLAGIRDRISALDTLAQVLVQTRVELLDRQSRQSANPSEASLQPLVDAANTAYKTAQANFNKSYEEVVKSIKNNGVLIYRWATDSTKSGSLAADGLLGTSFQQNQKRNGFALVSGVRTKTLFIGADLLTGWGTLNKDSKFSNHFEITTHIMQAKNIMYGNISDVAMYADAKIDASYQQLANPSETLKSLTKIEIAMALSKVSNLSNIGVMGNMRRSFLPVTWDEGALKKRLTDDTWLTFYSVESDFNDIRDLLKQTGM